MTLDNDDYDSLFSNMHTKTDIDEIDVSQLRKRQAQLQQSLEETAIDSELHLSHSTRKVQKLCEDSADVRANSRENYKSK